MAMRYRTLAQEQSKLLSFALGYWKKLAGSSRPKSRSATFLSDLELRITLLDTAGSILLPAGEWDLDSIDRSLLSKVIESLLDQKKILLAEQISMRFQFAHPDLEIITVARQFAVEGSNNLPGHLWDQIRTFQEQNESDKHDKSYVLHALSQLVNHGRSIIKDTITQWRVAEILRIPFADMSRISHYSTVRSLISYGRKYLDEARDVIELYALDETQVNLILANTFFQAIREGTQEGPRRISIGVTREQKEAEKISPFCSAVEFGEFVSITKEPRFIGDRFLHLYQNQGNTQTDTEDDSETESSNSYDSMRRLPGDWPDSVKTELLVRAHQSYVVSGHSQGIEMVLNTAKRFIKELHKRSQFKLLVRLLTGVHNYIELPEIFRILMENDCFELLLRKDLLKDEAEQTELRLAIFRYLQSNHPRDTSKLDLLFLSFKLYRERADSLMEQAENVIQEVGEFNSRNPRHTQDLGGAITLLLDSSDCYTKEKCFRLSTKALRLAALLTVQLATPQTNLLNLNTAGKETSASVFLLLTSLSDARDFAEVYGLNFEAQWIEALYSQVICKGNFGYWNEYLQVFPVNATLWVQISDKLRVDPLIAQRIPTFKHLLSYLDDQFVVLQLVRDLGLTDVPVQVEEPLYQSWFNQQK